MRRQHRLLLFVLLLIPALAFSHYLAEQETRPQDLITLVQDAYAQESDFHVHTSEAGAALVPLTPVYAGLKAQLQANKSNALSSIPHAGVSPEIKLVSIQANSAIALVKVYSGEEELYRDYVSLQKVQGKWTVKGRVYHVHS